MLRACCSPLQVDSAPRQADPRRRPGVVPARHVQQQQPEPGALLWGSCTSVPGGARFFQAALCRVAREQGCFPQVEAQDAAALPRVPQRRHGAVARGASHAYVACVGRACVCDSLVLGCLVRDLTCAVAAVVQVPTVPVSKRRRWRSRLVKAALFTSTCALSGASARTGRAVLATAVAARSFETHVCAARLDSVRAL